MFLHPDPLHQMALNVPRSCTRQAVKNHADIGCAPHAKEIEASRPLDLETLHPEALSEARLVVMYGHLRDTTKAASALHALLLVTAIVAVPSAFLGRVRSASCVPAFDCIVMEVEHA